MKKLSIILSILCITLTTFAQSDSTSVSTDTIPQKEDGRKITIKLGGGNDDDSTKVKTRVLMLDYGTSSYLHKGSLNMPVALEAMDQNLFGSANWTLHMIRQRINLTKKGSVNISYGLAFDFNRYKFTNDYTLQAEQNTVTFVDNPGVDFKKNTLSATYLTAPVLLGFKIKPRKSKKSFNIKVGGYGGILLASKTKQKIEGEKRVRVRDDFNLNRVRYGLTARAGYGWFNVYVNYGLNSMFKKEEQGIYDLQPINFGISIIPF